MGVLTDIFTDPPELVAAMQVKPGEPLKRTIGEAERIGPEHFIEQVDIDHAPRHGMSPPRQRPRRVAKKLAARGFAAHVGGRVFTAAQVRSTKHSAPALARWLDMPGLPTAGLTVDLGAVQVGAAGLASAPTRSCWSTPSIAAIMVLAPHRTASTSATSHVQPLSPASTRATSSRLFPSTSGRNKPHSPAWTT